MDSDGVGADSTVQPFIKMRGHKFVVVEMRIVSVHALDFIALARTESFIWIQAPDTFEQALPAEYFMQSRNTATVRIRGIEERGVGVGDFDAAAEQFGRNRFPALRRAP